MINNEFKLEWWNINYRKKEHLCHRARWKGKPDLADVIVDNTNSKFQIIYSTRLAPMAHQRFKRRKKWRQELITLSSLTVIVSTIYCSETTIYLFIFCTDGHKRTLNSLPEYKWVRVSSVWNIRNGATKEVFNNWEYTQYNHHNCCRFVFILIEILFVHLCIWAYHRPKNS